MAFRRRSAIVVHRVVQMLDGPSGRHFVTRGDGLSAADEPVARTALLGRVVAITRGPFSFAPGARVPLRWRLASRLFAWALACRTRLSPAWRVTRACTGVESVWVR
jgi:hypothetical protein